jgi:hypothetical protein
MNRTDTQYTGHGSEEATVTPAAQPCWLLKTAKAPKLGKHAEGGIAYQIATGSDRQEPMIQIAGNDGGGYFSKEAICFSRVVACLVQHPQGEPFPSKLFQGAFAGRSSNNAGFLAAILRAEGLLAAATETEGRHLISGDWMAWKAALLAEPGQAINTPPVAQIDSSPESEIAASATEEEKAPPRRGKK